MGSPWLEADMVWKCLWERDQGDFLRRWKSSEMQHQEKAMKNVTFHSVGIIFPWYDPT